MVAVQSSFCRQVSWIVSWTWCLSNDVELCHCQVEFMFALDCSCQCSHCCHHHALQHSCCQHSFVCGACVWKRRRRAARRYWSIGHTTRRSLQCFFQGQLLQPGTLRLVEDLHCQSVWVGIGNYDEVCSQDPFYLAAESCNAQPSCWSSSSIMFNLLQSVLQSQWDSLAVAFALNGAAKGFPMNLVLLVRELVRLRWLRTFWATIRLVFLALTVTAEDDLWLPHSWPFSQRYAALDW